MSALIRAFGCLYRARFAIALGRPEDATQWVNRHEASFTLPC
jgi:hypothetical protein